MGPGKERAPEVRGYILSRQAFSADGLRLKEVRSTNPDGTTNNCTRCCKGNPAFEVSADYNGGVNVTAAHWTKVPTAQTSVDGATVSLGLSKGVLAQLGGHGGVTGVGAAAVTGVRYAWSDYVDCVLVNADGPPLPYPYSYSYSTHNTGHFFVWADTRRAPRSLRRARFFTPWDPSQDGSIGAAGGR